MAKTPQCPFSKKIFPRTECIAHFVEPPQFSWLRKAWLFITDQASRMSYASLRNGWKAYSQANFNSLLPLSCRKDEPLSAFNTLVGKQWIVRDPAILQLVLKQFRNEKDGIFCVPENEKLFIDLIIKDLYPEEVANINDRERELINAVIFTAEAAHIPHLRGRVMGFLKQQRIQEYREGLDRIANNILDQLTPEEKQQCDSGQLAFEFALTVICQIFTGYQSTREGYQKIVSALVIIAKRIGDEILKRPQKAQDVLQYQNALQIIRELIQDNLNTNSPLIQELKENGLSSFSIRIYLYFFYLAATETTSAAIHYLILQLGRSQHLQPLIREELPDLNLLKKCIIEALRLNPPAYIVGRALKRDTIIELRNPENVIVYSQLLRKGQYLINWIEGIAKDSRLYSDPEQFNPFRFDTTPSQLPWLPFATGVHACPGQFLARAEMEVLITAIVKRFDIETFPSDVPIESKGIFTLHPDPQGKLKVMFKPRQRKV